MGSTNSFDSENLSLILAQECSPIRETVIEPMPYTFTKLENGKKTIIDSTSIVPPSWLLLDHTIAVVWLMFRSLSSKSVQDRSQLSNLSLLSIFFEFLHLRIPYIAQFTLTDINDLKWAYEFLREIRNNRGENPPDVKVCLKQIQDRLIELYARLINRGAGYKALQHSVTKALRNPFEKVFNGQTVSLRDMMHTKTGFPSNNYMFDDSDEEVEKFLWTLFEGNKEEQVMRSKSSMKNFSKVAPTMSYSEVLTSPEVIDAINKEKASKRVHCVAEMQSLQYQKSMKVQDTNSEEAAYADLKAEIKRLTFNSNIPKGEIRKVLQGWKMEQVDKVQNELNRLKSIQE
ncbi:hypothetical protein RUM43_012786 [Polyplax serrata]|uniref:Uncharacterized protein n=1 Tax=Polyplax serrata TaxID=468196 RepID=A0AAN8S9Q4_POLSC